MLRDLVEARIKDLPGRSELLDTYRAHVRESMQVPGAQQRGQQWLAWLKDFEHDRRAMALICAWERMRQIELEIRPIGELWSGMHGFRAITVPILGAYFEGAPRDQTLDSLTYQLQASTWEGSESVYQFLVGLGVPKDMLARVIR